MNHHNMHDEYVLRDEDAQVYGIDFMFGFQLTKPTSIFCLETFATLGYRHKTRDYTTLGTFYNNKNISWQDENHPIGKFHQDEDYPMVTIGLKIGFNAFFK
jgi:hypothetical protein